MISAETAFLFAVTMTVVERLAFAGRFFGGFLIAMAAIFTVLLLTKKISAWIDNLRK